ncbi:MAG: Gfo/Idh/MocA family oxidoreductase [Candidatus Hydrogenedentes bacterium]|nr:Gfo/Idh/MocA family oxidoreductase [Candidatus Hydrogenedentota bacterium]
MKRQSAHLPSDPNTNWSRRRFLGVSAAAWATVSIVPRHVLGTSGQASPNSRPNLAGVGIGGIGAAQLPACEAAGFQISALCDVDQVYGKKSFDKWPQARRYRDFREMLDTEGDKIDAVHIGTPDHTHTIIALEALKRKKHVCCVKPLTRTIEEVRVLVAAALKAGTATQVTASPNTTNEACRTCELIAAGAIGAVREVHIWSNRPIWPQGMERPEGQDAVPDTLDWKLWLGPAPARPFQQKWPEGHYALRQMNIRNEPISKGVYHPFNFRGWWDFGTGALGDMGCHHFNTPFRALKLKSPEGVHATSTRLFPETAPLASIVTYDFPAREGLPPVRVVWYDGGLRPPCPPEITGRPLPDEGVLYMGDRGTMLGSKILNPQQATKFETVPQTLPRRGGIWKEWMEAVRGGEKAGCHFEWAGMLAESVQLGNISIRTGQRLTWDADTATFKNNPQATALVKANYQNGWKLEGA